MSEINGRLRRALARWVWVYPTTGRHRAAGTPSARTESRLQRRRRWALWLASVGIGAGPRWIHGVRVMAR